MTMMMTTWTNILSRCVTWTGGVSYLVHVELGEWARLSLLSTGTVMPEQSIAGYIWGETVQQSDKDLQLFRNDESMALRIAPTNVPLSELPGEFL